MAGLKRHGVDHDGHFGTLRSLGKTYYVFVGNLHSHRLLSFSLQNPLFNHDDRPVSATSVPTDF